MKTVSVPTRLGQLRILRAATADGCELRAGESRQPCAKGKSPHATTSSPALPETNGAKSKLDHGPVVSLLISR